ncbi:ABC transporter ATP-binding protein [Paenibacillus typhae]|uniref:Energy-coupling factor transport system ATP-binding protein n=1 Tax=Paenibacillus typhae TaxID=1174501 RepID=A0A1G8WXZ9_9BACL|nr:ATP-binding cassette domain-containing protein [Paenibacillus typhae]SDJ83278.1 energy-coupling factor transport system ATP-binding protein [Paenibacillus typhae]
MDKPLLELSNVSFTYPGAEQPVLQEVSFTLQQGDFVAVIGSNGSGKSTLCKCFNGLIPHYYTGDFEGELKLLGESAEGKRVSELSRHIGYVYQDFENQLVRPTVLDDVCFTPLNYGLADYRERGQRALELTGLSGLSREFIWQLSGGQKHLLALAGALAMDPDILVIDEPVAQLDPQHARQIYEILRRLNEHHGKTIVVIEHHAEFIAEYCRSVVLMDGGRLRWQKPVREALTSVEELLALGIYPPDVTRAAWLLQPDRQAAGNYPLSCEEGRAWFGRRTAAVNAADPANAWSFAAASSDGAPAVPTGAAARAATEAAVNLSAAEPIVRMEQIRLSYRTIHKTLQPVLSGVNLELYAGERVALIGNNGAGKSSLMKLIAGITVPTGGTVQVKDITVNGLPPERLSDIVSYVFQNPEDMFIDDSVRGEIAYYLKARKLADMDARVEEMLQAFRLQELAERDARLLSGGQQRRVSLAIGAAVRPAVMLLDEPTANLDISTKQEMTRVLEALRGHVETVVIATHDMALVAEWASRIIVMSEGRIIADGDKEAIFSDGQLLRRAGLAETQLMEMSRLLNLPQICSSLKEFTAAAGGRKGELVHGGSR